MSAGRDDELAPVIPLFGAAPPRARWQTTWSYEPGRIGASADLDEDEDEDPYGPFDDDLSAGIGGDLGYDECGAIEREIAERNLLKKLRTRSLSVSEARLVVSERDLVPQAVEAVLQAFLDRGYLDDAALAEQLVHIGVDRKGHGRRVIAQSLAKRGIPADVAEAALAALPDDDAERALEFARTKAAGMDGLDRDVALRRLAGQLGRRGYGSVAQSSARQALDERSSGVRSGVRFE